MAEGSDNTYAPQSPDLSSFFSTTTTSSSIAPNSSAPTSAFPHNTRTASSASPAAFPGQHHLLPSSASSLTSSYTPRSPVLPATFAVPHDPHHQPQQSHHHQPPPPQQYVQFAPHLGHQQQQQQQQQLQSQHPQHQPYPQAALSPGGPNYYVPPLPQRHAAPSLGPSFQHHPQALVPTSIYPSQHQQSYSGGYPSSSQAIGGSGGLAQQYPDYDNMPGRPRGSRNVKVEEAAFDVNGANFGQSQFQAQAPIAMPQGPGPSQGIEVRTKFPVARIKRIMQADEEVGKVAQVTPVAVSKALELFMISLVMRSADVAKAKSSKRITAHHLKQAIEADEQFDFLNEIVAKVGDAPEPKKERERVKSDEDSDDLGAAKKKRGGRRKKSEE